MSPVHSQTNPETEPKKVPSGILLGKSEVIVGFLETLALPSLGNRQLSEKDFAVWDELLKPFSKDAIAFAFETWMRNASGAGRFPQPSMIIKLAETHHVTEQKETFQGCGNCYEGWLYSRNDPSRYRLGVKRCTCWSAWVEQRKKAG